MEQKIILKEKEKLEIIRNLLRIIKDNNNSISRKAIYRKLKIDKRIFDRIFKELFEKEFIRRAGKNASSKFSLADDGFRYLQSYDSMIKFIDDFRL